MSAALGWLWLSWAAAFADEPPLEGAARTHLDQAQLFYRRGWVDDAWAELQAALETPSGQHSYEAHRLGEAWAWERRDLRAALTLINRAVSLAPDSTARADATATALSYEQGFGFVQLDGPYPGMAARLQVRADAPPLIASHRQWLDDVTRTAGERQVLPVELALPVGDYRLNDQPIQVSAGTTQSVTLPLDAVGDGALRRLQAGRLDLLSGVSLWAGEDAVGLGLGLPVELAFSVPVGPIRWGPTAAVVRQTWQPPSGSERAGPMGWAAGARVSAAPMGAGAIAVELGAALRVGALPGIRLSCAAATSALRCAHGGPGDTPIHATRMALLPGADVGLVVTEPGRDRGLSGSLRLAWERPLVWLDSGGSAALPDGGDVPWSDEGRSPRLHGLRIVAGLSLSL